MKIRKIYDKNVENYAKNGGVILLDNLSYFISLISSGGKILDSGSGVGQDVEFFYKKGFEATGIDFSRKMIEYSRKKRRGGTFAVGDLFQIKNKFSKENFDGIWISSVITHLKENDITKALKIARWVLSSNGIMGVIVKKRSTKKIRKGRGDTIFNEFYKKDIVNYFNLSNLKIKNISEFDAHDKKWFFIVATKRN